MFLVSLGVVCSFLSLSVSKPFQPRGSNPIGTQYWNLTTSISTTSVPDSSAVSSSSATAVALSSWTSSSRIRPFPIAPTGTGIRSTDSGGYAKPTGQGTTAVTTRKNDTGPPCTVNVPSATIDWWFAATFAYEQGRFRRVRAVNYTQSMISYTPNTATFDLTSALDTAGAYTETTVYDSESNETWTYMDEYTVRPSATITSIITRSSLRTVPTGGIVPLSDFLYYDGGDSVDPASKVVLGTANKTVYAATSTTPVLYFSVYEVVSQVSNSIATQTFSLPEPFAAPYFIKGIEDQTVATGTVPADFLQYIPQTSCEPGNVQATVEVIFVLDYYYLLMPNANPFIVHIESSVRGFDDPETPSTQDVLAENTGRPKTGKAMTIGSDSTVTRNVPIIQQSEPGFSVSEPARQTSDAVKPQLQPSSAPNSNSGGNNNAGGSPGQGPNGAAPTRQTVGTIGTNPVVVGPSSVVIVGTQTLTPGQPPVTIGGVPISIAPSATAIVVGGKTSSLPQIAVPVTNGRPAPVLTIGSSTLTGNAATQFFISSGQILTPGGTATVDGTLVSLAPSASFVVVGGSTQLLPTTAPTITTPPEVVVGGTTFTADSSSRFVIGDQTLAPGQQITVDGTTVSLAPSASFVVVDGSTQILPTASAGPALVVDGSTFVGNSGSTFTIEGQTLAPGQQITVDGTTISLGPSASFVVINGATSTFANPATQITPPPLTIGDGVFTALPGDGTTYRIGGYYLTPGGAITVGDTTISLAPGATALIINGQTTYLNPSAAPITNAPLLTIGSNTYTADHGTTFIIDGQTLTPGGTITVDGTTISLSPGATTLVYGENGQSTTETLFPATTTRSMSVTGTGQPSAGATGQTPGASETNTKGSAYMVRPSGLESWVLSLFIAFAGFVLG